MHMKPDRWHFKTVSLECHLWKLPATICLPFALIMLHLAPLVIVQCSTPAQTSLTPVNHQKIQVTYEKSFALVVCLMMVPHLSAIGLHTFSILVFLFFFFNSCHLCAHTLM